MHLNLSGTPHPWNGILCRVWNNACMIWRYLMTARTQCDTSKAQSTCEDKHRACLPLAAKPFQTSICDIWIYQPRSSYPFWLLNSSDHLRVLACYTWRWRVSFNTTNFHDLCPRMRSWLSFDSKKMFETRGCACWNDSWREACGVHSCTLCNREYNIKHMTTLNAYDEGLSDAPWGPAHKTHVDSKQSHIDNAQCNDRLKVTDPAIRQDNKHITTQLIHVNKTQLTITLAKHNDVETA